MKVREVFIILSIIILSAIGITAIYWSPILWVLIIVGPLVLMGISDITQSRHAIKKNFPVIGRIRYLLEGFRPEIMQYFVETDLEGRPINRVFKNACL